MLTDRLSNGATIIEEIEDEPSLKVDPESSDKMKHQTESNMQAKTKSSTPEDSNSSNKSLGKEVQTQRQAKNSAESDLRTSMSQQSLNDKEAPTVLQKGDSEQTVIESEMQNRAQNGINGKKKLVKDKPSEIQVPEKPNSDTRHNSHSDIQDSTRTRGVESDSRVTNSNELAERPLEDNSDNAEPTDVPKNTANGSKALDKDVVAKLAEIGVQSTNWQQEELQPSSKKSREVPYRAMKQDQQLTSPKTGAFIFNLSLLLCFALFCFQ